MLNHEKLGQERRSILEITQQVPGHGRQQEGQDNAQPQPVADMAAQDQGNGECDRDQTLRQDGKSE